MTKQNIQGRQQKSQQSRKAGITLNESKEGGISISAGGTQRSRKGTAADTTGSTGPRKK
ncbi:MAG: hypothetical protein ACTSW1_19090 [Candidatus Hodarchaeales archaeon]